MDIRVNKQTEEFYLAFEDGWMKVTGHRISVGKYAFCAIPLQGCLNISEVETGCKVMDIPEDSRMLWATATKEGAMKYFYRIGQSLERIVRKTTDFDEQLKNLKEKYRESIGERPPINSVDTEWIFKDRAEE